MNGSEDKKLEQALENLGQAIAPARGLATNIVAQLRPLPRARQHFYARRWFMRTTIGVAAGLVVAAMVASLVTQPKVAFAQIAEKVEQTRTLTGDFEGQGKMHIVISGEFMRVETPNGSVSIGNRTTGKWLMLDATNHTAMTITMARQPFDMYAWIKDFKDGKEEKLGEKELGGKKVIGFKVTRQKPNIAASETIAMTIWVDAVTSLPLEVEGKDEEAFFEGEKVSRFTNLKWNEPVDEKLFEMIVPQGYKVDDMGGIAAGDLKAPPAAKEAEAYLLKPDAGMGALNFGDTPERVTEVLGKPETLRAGIDWGYPSKGLFISVDARSGMWSVMATSKKGMSIFNVNDFIGKTDKGIGMGSTRKEVEAAYGKPERVDGDPTQPTLVYGKPEIWFTIQKDEVVQIFMNAPREAILKARERAATQATQPAR